jgi:16S rRNA (guanine1207-N2)-methyltransferase
MNIAEYKNDITFRDRLLGQELEFHTTWGLFSPKQVDEGTKLLLEQIKPVKNARVLDLGCGYGAIGLAIAKAWPDATVEMVDKDFVAVDFARANAERNNLHNAHAYLSNGMDQVETLQFDLIISNLPAKVSGELFDIWFADVYDKLLPGGYFYVVTVSGIREYIKRKFNETFGNYDKLAQSKTYTVAAGQK